MKSIITAFLLFFMSPVMAAERVYFPWKGDYAHNSSKTWTRGNEYESGWSRNFRNGAPEERGIVEKNGNLAGLLFKPKVTDGSIPFIVVLHPCGGLIGSNIDLVRALSEKLVAQGYGVLAPDSDSTRGVSVRCGEASGLHWAYRRAEDAYSALDYLIKEKLAKPDQVYVVGYSNGGSATLIAMSSRMKDHSNRFAAGFAIVPSCGPAPIKASAFYNPIVIFSAAKDVVTPAKACEELERRKRSTPLQLVVFESVDHQFMFNRPPAVLSSIGLTYGMTESATNQVMAVIYDRLKTGKFIGK